MALATLATMTLAASPVTLTTSRPFTRWQRSMDDGWLALVVESASGRMVECVELDVRQLPCRPDLLARLGLDARSRLLADAVELGE